MNTRFHDLQFSRQQDGSIRLVQSDCGEEYIIDLHPVQLGHIAETFGLTAPSYRAGELTKLLAEQLGTIYKELANECHRSPWLEQTYAKLDGFMFALPESVFPFHLWDDDDQPKAASASKPVAPRADTDIGKQTQQSAIASELNSNPNLYDLLKTGNGS